MKKLMRLLSNNPPARNTGELWQHFSDTYFSLRLGLALLSFSLPLVLWAVGKYGYGLDLQRSMSAYFWAAGAEQCASFPMRTIFVGFLCAIGAGLYAYKGLTPLENSLLNVAGICAVLVASVPEGIAESEGKTNPQVQLLFTSCPAVKEWAVLSSSWFHYAAAITLFVMLVIVAAFCANKSLEYLPDARDQKLFRYLYQVAAAAMLLFPAVGLAVAYLLGLWQDKTFFIEAAGVVTFAFYWAIKTRELHLSSLEKNPAAAVDFANQRAQAPGAGDKGGA